MDELTARVLGGESSLARARAMLAETTHMSAKPKPAKRKPKAKKPPGRPSIYSPKVAARICQRLSNGEPLTDICRDPAFPATRTVSGWTKARPEFSEDFRAAREEGFDAIAHRCRETARGRGGSTSDVQRDKLIIDLDLKLLSKWDPKRYGDKIDLELPGETVVKIVIGGSC